MRVSQKAFLLSLPAILVALDPSALDSGSLKPLTNLIDTTRRLRREYEVQKGRLRNGII